MTIPDNCRFCGANLKALRGINDPNLWLAARRQLAFHLSGGCIPTEKEVNQVIANMEAGTVQAQAVRDKWDIARALRPRPRLSRTARAAIIFTVAAVLALVLSYWILHSIKIKGLDDVQGRPVLMIEALSRTEAGKAECSADGGQTWFPGRPDGMCYMADAPR